MNIHPIKAFTDNYIWAIHDGRWAVVVDPGDAVPVSDFLEAHDLELAGILITHHHPDHIGGLENLQSRWSCPVYAPKDERIPGNHTTVIEGDHVRIGSLNLELHVKETPGHTLSHIIYYNDDWLFCGDTLFSLGCGRMFEGTPQQFQHSLAQIKALPDHLAVYCTHEYTQSNGRFALHVLPEDTELKLFMDHVNNKRSQDIITLPSTLSQEKQLNPFLRLSDPMLLNSLQKHSSRPITSEVDAFAVLRQWKDHF